MNLSFYLRRTNSLVVTLLCATSAAFGYCAALRAETANVTLRVELVSGGAKSAASSAGPASVAWLTPVDPDAAPEPLPQTRAYRMVQENKEFNPHILVVPVGSTVHFPNRDPFFHNVFSLYNGKRFDLGLYETGSERGVKFDREGISYVFCDIHPEMGAVILALATPYYAISRNGEIAVPNVPPGKYTLNVWSEGATAQSQAAARKQVTIAAGETNLGSISLTGSAGPGSGHANKFGEPYPPKRASESPGAY